MTKFMVVQSLMSIVKPEPAVIFLEGDDFRVEGNMKTGEAMLRLVNSGSAKAFNVPKEKRFDWFRSGSTYGSMKTWVGDTDNPEDAERLRKTFDEWHEQNRAGSESPPRFRRARMIERFNRLVGRGISNLRERNQTGHTNNNPETFEKSESRSENKITEPEGEWPDWEYEGDNMERGESLKNYVVRMMERYPTVGTISGFNKCIVGFSQRKQAFVYSRNLMQELVWRKGRNTDDLDEIIDRLIDGLPGFKRSPIVIEFPEVAATLRHDWTYMPLWFTNEDTPNTSVEYLNHIVRIKSDGGNAEYFILEDGVFRIRASKWEDLDEWKDYFVTNADRWKEILEEFETPWEAFIRNPYNRELVIEEDDAGEFQGLLDESSEMAEIVVTVI